MSNRDGYPDLSHLQRVPILLQLEGRLRTSKTGFALLPDWFQELEVRYIQCGGTVDGFLQEAQRIMEELRLRSRRSLRVASRR